MVEIVSEKPPEDAARYRALLGPEPPEAIQTYLAKNEPERYSMLRTSIVPTLTRSPFRPLMSVAQI